MFTLYFHIGLKKKIKKPVKIGLFEHTQGSLMYKRFNLLCMERNMCPQL